MSTWTHSICNECWNTWWVGEWLKKNKTPPGEPVRLNEGLVKEEKCCTCLKPHTSGIFVRMDPKKCHRYQAGDEHP